MGIKVRSEIEIYEVDGKETSALSSKRPHVVVESHWNRSEMIVVTVDDKKYTMVARDLQCGITNATNTGKP
jgi:hypothetical protein